MKSKKYQKRKTSTKNKKRNKNNKNLKLKNKKIIKKRKVNKNNQKIKKKKTKLKIKKDKNKKKQKEKLAGKITHYFSKIKVAVVKLSSPLSLGDKIRITGGDISFIQPVKSMEVNHKKIKRAKSKQIIGLKVRKRVRKGYRIYKVYY